MATKKTLSYYAEQLRRMGDRRIARLEEAINSSGATDRTKKWAKKKISEITRLQKNTLRYNPKTGKKYTSKNDAYIGKQMTRLAKSIEEIAPRYTIGGDPYEVTQQQLNLASVGKPSVYTKPEVKLFYRVTQKIWQREGVGEHDRNEAILSYFNDIRRENKLSELTLDQIVEGVLKANKTMKNLQMRKASDFMDTDQNIFYQILSQLPDADGDTSSPTSETVVQGIRDAMSQFLVEPNPSRIVITEDEAVDYLKTTITPDMI